MWTLTRRFGLGLILLMIPATTITAQPQQTVLVTKCQDCSNKAAKSFQSCQANGGAPNAQACQKKYQGRMNHCNKKWCNQKTKKVKVQTGS